MFYHWKSLFVQIPLQRQKNILNIKFGNFQQTFKSAQKLFMNFPKCPETFQSYGNFPEDLETFLSFSKFSRVFRNFLTTFQSVLKLSSLSGNFLKKSSFNHLFSVCLQKLSGLQKLCIKQCLNASEVFLTLHHIYLTHQDVALSCD